MNEQQPEITDEMIENYIEENTDMYSLDNQEQSDIRKAIKWALSLKAQPERGEKHDTCDGCQMFQDCGCMLDDSCPECVDHHLWTPKEQPSDNKEISPYLLSKDEIEETIKKRNQGYK